MFRQHPVLSLATFVYLGLVGWITLGPQPLDEGRDSLLWRALRFFGRHDLTDWITYQRLEFTANVFMFIPIGMFLLLLVGRRLWFVAILAGVALTVTIETVQLFLPDRVSDVSDIIANSVGTLIGVLFTLVVTSARARRDARTRGQRRLRTSSNA
jgi:VanZ family protein